MCNRARMSHEPETIVTRFGTKWLADRPMDNRFNPQELYPFGRAWVVRQDERGRGVDVMGWDVLGGQAIRSPKAGAPPRPVAMTNVRTLGLPQWRRLADHPRNRCLIPLTEFCEWSREKDPEHGIKGEMWFRVIDQPVFAIAGFWQMIGDRTGFAMVTCDPNDLVKPIHPRAMITVLEEADWDRWLTGTYDDAPALQRPYPADRMTVRGPEFPTRRARP